MSLFHRLKQLFHNGSATERESSPIDMKANTSAVDSQLQEAQSRLGEFALVITREETLLIRLQEEASGEESAVDSWLRQATAAIAAGKDEIARVCIQRKRECEERSAEKVKRVSEQREVVRQLKARYRAMEEELDHAQQQVSDLSHRGELASVTIKAGQAVHQLSSISFESQLDAIRKDVSLSEGIADTTSTRSRQSLDEELDALYNTPSQSPERVTTERDADLRKEGSSE